jgi:hypothetical protein
MVGLAMCFQNYAVDYTTQKRKKKDLVAYLGFKPNIGDTEPSDILVMFPPLLI